MSISKSNPTNHRRAFTLIELLVVIAIIGLLLAVIIPAIKSAKNVAAAAVCLANESQLIKSWLLYSDDNDANIVDGDTSDNFDGHETYSSGRVWCWVGRPMGPQKQPVNKTVDDKIRGFQVGGLWPYVEAPKVYNCPIDKRYVKLAVNVDNDCGKTKADWYGGYRSYSIGKVLSKRPAGNNNDSGEEDYEVSKLSEFTSPGSKIVFIEEMDGYGWNHRTWNMYVNTARWVDPFAIWHNRSSTFAYADGHADRHKWLSKRTFEMAKSECKSEPGAALNDAGTAPSEDYLWFKRAYIPGK